MPSQSTAATSTSEPAPPPPAAEIEGSARVEQLGNKQVAIRFSNAPRGSCASIAAWDGATWVDTGWQVSGGEQDSVSVASIADGCFDDEVDGALLADFSDAIAEFGTETWFRVCDRSGQLCSDGFVIE